MHRNEYRRMAHEEVEEIFREILPQAGMKVREEQITLCHQMLSSLCGNKIALCDAAVGVGKTYAYLVACILFRKYSQLLSGYFSMCGQSQPIVISTSSIALQEAIQREYIPFFITGFIEERNHICPYPSSHPKRESRSPGACRPS